MTTKLLQQIQQMARDGWCDAEIARRLGIHVSVARSWRVKAGLPYGRKGMRNKTKCYAVYDGKTSDFLFEGTIEEVAQFLGKTMGGIYSCISRNKSGKLRKYEFYEVEI